MAQTTPTCVHQSSLVSLPAELLLQIIESLDSLKDVARLRRTCRTFHTLIGSESCAITNAFETFPPFSAAEAEKTVKEQLSYDHAGWDWEPPVPDTQVAIDLALSAVPSLTDPSMASRLVTNDAIRLAKAQNEFTRFTFDNDRGSRKLFEKRKLEATMKKSSFEPVFCEGQMHYLELRHRLSQNVKDATIVLLITAPKHFQHARPEGLSCVIHLDNTALLHDQDFRLSAWYHVKLYVLSYFMKDLREGLKTVLETMSSAQRTYCALIHEILCFGAENGLKTQLGIRPSDVQDPNPVMVFKDWFDSASRFWFQRPDNHNNGRDEDTCLLLNYFDMGSTYELGEFGSGIKSRD